MANRYYLSLPDPQRARGSDPALAFSAHGADEFALQLQEALRSDALFARWRDAQEDPDAVDDALGAHRHDLGGGIVQPDVFLADQRLVFGNLVFLHLTHGLSLALPGQKAPDKLRRVVDDRHDAAVVQPRRSDHAHGADDLTVSVHIGRDHQRGTRK